MFSKLSVIVLAALAVAATAAPEPKFGPPPPHCDCPDRGHLEATSPAIQCAYGHGACTWDDVSSIVPPSLRR